MSFLLLFSSFLAFLPTCEGFVSPSLSFTKRLPVIKENDATATLFHLHERQRNGCMIGNIDLSMTSTDTDSTSDLVLIGKKLTNAMIATDLFKDVKISIAPSPNTNRLGVFANQDLKSDEVALSIPYDDLIILSAENCQKTVLKQYIPENYDGWTGDAGLIAMNLLYELARSASSEDQSNFLPKRSPSIQQFMSIWVQSLPFSTPNNEEKSFNDLPYQYSHPISTWNEDEQESLQYSSTKKLYRLLDDIEEDATWWEERVWSQNRDVFPETFEISSLEDNGVTVTRNCFNQAGFKWAMAMVNSRAIFVDGMLRLVPIADYANHYDEGIQDTSGLEAQEIQSGFFGTFGTSKGVQIKTPQNTKKRNAIVTPRQQEVYVSYGPKTPIDYLLEHGFLPTLMIEIASQPPQKTLSNRSKSTTNRGLSEVAELTFEIPESDRFYDDKLDILEFESPLGNPSQSFDITSVDDPDPVMIQFLRLLKLEGMDAFLLESIFRKEVWDFMGMPVSEKNEEIVVEEVRSVCEAAIESMKEAFSAEDDEVALQNLESLDNLTSSPQLMSTVVRVLERRALLETMSFMEREKEALDLKEYYQERRLKDLGLDSEWNEDENNPDVGWGQTRAPGSGDLDW